MPGPGKIIRYFIEKILLIGDKCNNVAINFYVINVLKIVKFFPFSIKIQKKFFRWFQLLLQFA